MGLDLVTAAEYKAYYGISSTTNDGTINSLIPKVSNLVKSICRRTFLDYVDEQKVDINRGGSNTILLTETPLLTFGSLEFSDDYGKTYTALVEYTDYVVDADNGSIELIVAPYQGYKRVNAYKISYTAGYTELPQDLKLAIFDMISYYIRNEAAVHSQKAIGSNSVQIEYITTTSLPSHIRRVLDLHTAYYG
jgi:hypothetical protein